MNELLVRLGELLGWGAGPIVVVSAVCGVFWGVRSWHLNTILLAPDAYRAEAERAAYRERRTRILTGLPVYRRYRSGLASLLSATDRLIGDTDEGPTQRNWSVALLDKCVAWAVFYPAAGIFVFWLATGQAGPVGDVLGLSADIPGWRRALAVGGMALFFGLAAGTGPLADAAERRWKDGWRSAVAPLLRGARYRVALVGVLTMAWLAGAGLIVVAGAVVVVVTATVAVTVAVAGAVAFAGAGAFAVTGAVAVAGVVAVATGHLADFLRRRHGRARYLALLGCLMLVSGGSLFLLRETRADVVGAAGLLPLFFAVIPLLNAVFDWLSIGATRWLLRSGLAGSVRGRRLIALSLADLAIALVLLTGLSVSLVAIAHAANALSGTPLVDVGAILVQLRETPWNPGNYWVYLTVFSTMLPSAINLVCGGISVMPAWLGPRGWIVNRYLPDNPLEMTQLQRDRAALFLTLYWMWLVALGVILLAVAVMVIALVVGLFDVSLGGFLLSAAEWADHRMYVLLS